MMNYLWLHSTKYDGSLHYRYPVRLVERSLERLTTYCEPGTTMESYRGSRIAERHILSLFWRDQSCVLHVEWTRQWQPEYLYIDITTGTSWVEGTIRYIDLDLDLILRQGSTAVQLLDVDEFETHRVRWGYPEDLVRSCWSAVEEVRSLLETGKEPFNPSMFAWRPGEPLRV
jgi:protein associated with RNAse G/E